MPWIFCIFLQPGTALWRLHRKCSGVLVNTFDVKNVVKGYSYLLFVCTKHE